MESNLCGMLELHSRGKSLLNWSEPLWEQRLKQSIVTYNKPASYITLDIVSEIYINLKRWSYLVSDTWLWICYAGDIKGYIFNNTSWFQVLKVYPYPVTVTLIQFAVGTVLVLFMWGFNLYKRPKISGTQVVTMILKL